MSNVSCVRRHYRQIRRTFVICVVCTCVAVLLFSGTIVTPIYEITREMIVSGGGLSHPNDLKNKTYPTLENSTLSSTTIGGQLLFQTSSIITCKTFTTWSELHARSCDNKLALYANKFARLKNVEVVRRFCQARARGGEEIRDVFNRAESAEYYTTKKGCFRLSCPSGVPLGYFADRGNYLTKWLHGIETALTNQTTSDVRPMFTIAIERRDYANIYWSMNDWYVTYLMMTFFNQSAVSTNILLVDAHPKSNLDATWSTLFNSSTRFSELLSERVLFLDMVWGLQGYNSMLLRPESNDQAPPLMEEFRTFFLTRHRVEPVKDVDCRRVSVLFSWRHNYVAHPRNPQGTVQRKIANELELIDSTRRAHPSYKVTLVILS